MEKFIAKKCDLKQAAMQQLLTGQRRLREFKSCGEVLQNSEAGVIPQDWEATRLGELFSFKNGLNKGKQYFGYGTPIVNYMDVYRSSSICTRDLKVEST
jgi:type I restriction enzyme, S subunit